MLLATNEPTLTLQHPATATRFSSLSLRERAGVRVLLVCHGYEH
jgi:hypothetical protein